MIGRQAAGNRRRCYEGDYDLWCGGRTTTNHKGDRSMSTWTNDELNRIGAAEELQIAPLRGDGTLRNPVTIWVVRLGDDLYVRSYKGRDSAWFRGAQERHE